MKKNDVLKIISIMFLVVVVLTWFIPTGGYTNGAFVKGDVTPLGLFDLVRLPIISFAQLAINGVIFLIIGGIYGVLNKTGVYSNIVDGIVKKFKGNEKKFVVISIVTFAVLSSFIGSTMVLFMLVPFVVAIILLMGYSNLVALSSTVGAILVGKLASTYGSGVSNYLIGYFNQNVHAEWYTKVILLGIVTFLLVVFVLKTCEKKKPIKAVKEDAKKTTKKASKVEVIEVKKDIPLYEKNSDKKKSTLPLIIIAVLAIVIMLLATFDLEGTFGITLFKDLYNSITKIEIMGYPLFKNLLGTVSVFGQWGNYDLSMFMLFIPIIIGWIYNIKFKDIMEGFIDGVKKMLPVAFYVLLASVIFAFVATSQSGATIYGSIQNWILNLTDGFNLATTSIVSLISGFFYNDFQYAVYNISSSIQTLIPDTTIYPLISIIVQTMHGMVMLILPTSIVLVAGLSYLNVSVKEWIKYIWKYLLQVLVVLVIVFVIIAILI